MNSTDYGGGTPVSDIWRRDVGIAIGQLERVPKLVSLPDQDAGRDACDDGALFPVGHDAQARRVARHLSELRRRASTRLLSEPEGLQCGDAASRREVRCGARKRIRRDLVRLGLRETVTPSQVENALPVVKKLGFKWVGVDDGWQTNEGDWALLPAKFPNGDRDMQGSWTRSTRRASSRSSGGRRSRPSRTPTSSSPPRATAVERGRLASRRSRIGMTGISARRTARRSSTTVSSSSRCSTIGVTTG